MNTTAIFELCSDMAEKMNETAKILKDQDIRLNSTQREILSELVRSTSLRPPTGTYFSQLKDFSFRVRFAVYFF
jgi:hypothetical protein